jgi:Fe-S cluster assembly protein SufD
MDNLIDRQKRTHVPFTHLEQYQAYGLDSFFKADWPTCREEPWRRTDISGVDFSAFSPHQNSNQGHSLVLADDHAQVAGYAYFNGTHANGYYLDEKLKQRGVFLGSLAQGIKLHPAAYQHAFRKTQAEQDKFVLWNYSSITHGVYLHIPANMELDQPIQIDFREAGVQKHYHPHLFIDLGENARADVVVHMAGEHYNLWNPVVLIAQSQASHLNFFQQQKCGPQGYVFQNGWVFLQEDAQLNHLDVALGGAMLKTSLTACLEGSGSYAQMSGIYLANGGQHMDVRTVQQHKAPNAYSRAVYKGAVRESARAIYQGLIHVLPEAQKTDAYLTNKNLILDEGARADSIPSLKIETNDVKCSHGSTTGKVQDSEMFYLMSRGLSRKDATELIIMSYFQDLIDLAPEHVKADLTREIHQHIHTVQV